MGNYEELVFLIKEYSHNIFLRVYLFSQIIIRIILSILALKNDQISIDLLPSIFAAGFIGDIISTFFAIPIIVLLQRIKYCPIIGHIIFSFFIVFISIAQIIFWDEYNSNFNFIAVDYLVYTHEIYGTLAESLPIYTILAGIVLSSLILTGIIHKYANKFPPLSMKLLIGTFICAITIGRIYNSAKFGPADNNFAHEISKNGPYEFSYAFLNNSLDYTKFYPVIASDEALNLVRSKIENKNTIFLDENGINRNVISHGKLEKYNIIVIAVESLSAEFMAHFGGTENITPNLDKIADEGILFTNIYATGTRTVRGLEAITLAIPPLPGSSIIRRLDNKKLFTIGIPFRENGYALDFIYGGYSYFDNLENYFRGNNFSILDRSNLSDSEISFSNIWGVADEDIFNKSLKKFDRHYKNHKPFLSIIMTTSNHRPYNFPDGRIDLPSGGGRPAAVKYTDYAIGKFINDAKTKPWFKDTIFIITADHCASSAGKTKLPVEKYHIPLIIYAPSIVQPAVNNNLASQIDIPPTILGFMNFAYNSKFLGVDLLSTNPKRAFISTYQLMGYLKDDILVILAPNTGPVSYRISGKEQKLMEAPDNIIKEAIGYYQATYELFSKGKMKDGL
jgi:phosphoglycerol transferase MdoB-like AlkP superfamily enzyme